MKTIKKSLTAETLQTELAKQQANLTLLKTLTGAESMVDQIAARIAEIEEDLSKLAGVDKVAEFAELFINVECVNIEGENVEALTEKQVAFIGDGEGIIVKLTADGKLKLVKKAGGNGGNGTKSPTPYSEFYLNGKTFKTAADLVKSEGGILDVLKAGGVEIKVSTANSMRREAVKLNADNKLGITVKDRDTSEVYALIDSPHEKKGAAAETDEQDSAGE